MRSIVLSDEDDERKGGEASIQKRQRSVNDKAKTVSANSTRQGTSTRSASVV
jgi:hypothetical protein